MSIETVTVIKKTAILNLKVSTGFYQRIQAILTFVIAGKTPEELNAAHEAIKNNSEKEPWMFHYETLLIMCKEFEKIAKDSGETEVLTKEEFQRRITEEIDK